MWKKTVCAKGSGYNKCNLDIRWGMGNRRELPKHLPTQAQVTRGPKTTAGGGLPRVPPPSFQAVVTAPSASSLDPPSAAPPSLVGKKDLKRRHSQKVSPLSGPLSSHRPWPPAAVFLIEARCGPDALGGSGGQGHEEGSIPGPAAPAPAPAAEPRQHPSSWEGVGATHALPRSPWPRSPIQGGSLLNQILSPFF